MPKQSMEYQYLVVFDTESINRDVQWCEAISFLEDNLHYNQHFPPQWRSLPLGKFRELDYRDVDDIL